MCAMDDMENQGHAWADRLTRTQWLLVALLGLVGWMAGYASQEPFLAVPGALVVLFSLLCAWHTARKG